MRPRRYNLVSLFEVFCYSLFIAIVSCKTETVRLGTDCPRILHVEFASYFDQDTVVCINKEGYVLFQGVITTGNSGTTHAAFLVDSTEMFLDIKINEHLEKRIDLVNGKSFLYIGVIHTDSLGTRIPPRIDYFYQDSAHPFM